MREGVPVDDGLVLLYDVLLVCLITSHQEHHPKVGHESQAKHGQSSELVLNDSCTDLPSKRGMHIFSCSRDGQSLKSKLSVMLKAEQPHDCSVCRQPCVRRWEMCSLLDFRRQKGENEVEEPET